MRIREDVRRFVVDNFLFGAGDQLQDGDSFLENGVLDSTGILELIAFIEERFAVRLQDFELVPENLDSIERIERFLQRRVGAAV